jgi:hypothetical protein
MKTENTQSELNVSPKMSPLERRVWELNFRGAGIGTIMIETGKGERVVSAAYNRAEDKQREHEYELKMRICATCGKHNWQCECK